MKDSFCVFSPVVDKEVLCGDSLSELFVESFSGEKLEDNDIVCITHKVVSKSEGQVVRLSSVSVSDIARHYAEIVKKDPRLIEVILSQSADVVSAVPNGPFIVRTKDGIVCANGAVDCSNSSTEDEVILLPQNIDASAARIRRELEAIYGVSLAVIICDSHGRAFRKGCCGVALGASGIEPLKSYIGKPDRRGRTMQSSKECIADELAGVANLVMGQGNESRPFVIVRGFNYCKKGGNASVIIRPREQDLFLSKFGGLK